MSIPKNVNNSDNDPNSEREKLKELIARESKPKAKEVDFLDIREKKEKRKKVALYTSIGAVAFALIAGVTIYDPFTNSLRFGDGQNTVVAAPPEESVAPAPPVESKQWYQESENLYPISLDEWQKKPFDSQDKGQVLGIVGEREASTSLGSSSNVLPQESTGYTPDINQQELEDGTINPMFSYWTAENFTQEVGTMLERLVNPTFGGWETAQYSSSDFQTETLQDLFTDKWLGSEGLNPQSYPVYVDWSDNSYGLSDQLLLGGTRWAGDVQTVTTNFVFNPETSQYDVNLVANVKYTAWNKDQSKIEKNGVLTLNLVANPEQSKGASENRVLIDSAKLEVS